MNQLWEPLADAEILLAQDNDLRRKGALAPVHARTRSDREGRFRLRGLALAQWNLRVRAEGWVERQTYVSLSIRRPEHRGLVLVLHRGHALTGTVVEPGGKPVEGAWVVVSWPREWGSQKQWPEVRTDQQGRFAFGSVPRGKIHILAWAEGRSLGVVEGESTKARSWRIELPELGPYRLRFSLADPIRAGDPKPTDVRAQLFFMADHGIAAMPDPIRWIDVPTEGEAILKGLRVGSYQVHLAASSVDLEWRYHGVELLPTKTESSQRIAWSTPLGLAGRLMHPDGKPAADIILRTNGSSGIDTHRVRTDAQGRFSFPACFGAGVTVWIYMESPGFWFELGDRKRSFVGATPGREGQVFRIAPTALFAGRVVDAKAQAVAGAKVWLRSAKGDGQAYGSTTTDGQGGFRLSPIRPTAVPLVLDAKDHYSFCLDPVRVDKDQPRPQEGMVLHLTRGAWIEGEVVDEEGSAVAGVSVSAIFTPRSQDATQTAAPRYWRTPIGIGHATTTDEGGRFRLVGLAPGAWKVSAKQEGRIRRSEDAIVDVSAGEERGDLRFVLASGLSISGRLVTDSGRPLTKTWVYARFNGKPTPTDGGGKTSARTNQEGEFELQGLRPGKYILATSLPWNLKRELRLDQPGPDGVKPMLPTTQYKTEAIAGTTDFRWQIPLPRFGGMRARIQQSGPPLQRIRILVRSGKKSWTFRLPVKKGVVSMSRMLTGTHDLTFVSPRFADHEVQAVIREGQVTDLGWLRLMDLPEREGRILDETGKGLGGVWIGLDPGLKKLWAGYVAGMGPEQFGGQVLTQTDASGGFRVPGKGQLLIHAFKPGYAPGVLVRNLLASKHASGQAPGKDGKDSGTASTLVLTLRRAGELSLVAPTAAGGGKTDWVARLIRYAKAPQGGKKPKVAWSRSIRLTPGKPKRIIGIRPGAYHLQAADLVQTSGLTDRSAPGKSYCQELVILPTTQRTIRIP